MRVKGFFFVLTVLLGFLPSGFAQDARPIVQIVYFRPSDMPLPPGVDAEIDAMIKKAQRFFADKMEDHGFGRKTFQFEADANGNVVVHHVNGKLPIADYENSNYAWVPEINEQIHIRHERIPVYMIERGQKRITVGRGCGEGSRSGAHIYCWGWTVVAHELGHAFGLPHDFRTNTYIMSYGITKLSLSKCSAEWLNVHPFFNVGQAAMSERSTIKMLPPTLASLPNNIHLRFEITDPDGLHQAKLILPTDNEALLDCKPLSGESSIIEFDTTGLRPTDKWINLSVIDIRGDITYQGYSIDITALLPPPEVVLIPDKNLAKQVRTWLRLAPEETLTTHAMLNLKVLAANDSQIRDITGLEHAYTLRTLNLRGNPALDISDVSALSGLTQLTYLDFDENGISDISALSEFTQLRTLYLRQNRISDISALSGLTQLTYLELDYNNISDISVLSRLTQLIGLSVGSNSISDISALSGLTQLTSLWLPSNSISDISALSGLIRLDELFLRSNRISDISALSELTQLTYLVLDSNNISDISALSGLTQLATLWIEDNNISDISALSGLTQLASLNLGNNNISDVSPLRALNLTRTESDLGGLYLHGNPLSFASINTHIPALQAKGIAVTFDNVAHPAFVKISDDTQEGAAGALLTSPFVVEIQDEKGQPMKDVPVTFTIHAGGGILSPTTTKTDAEGKARTFLTLGWIPGPSIVRATADGIPSYVQFTAMATVLTDRLATDVNGDSAVDVEDLLLVAASVGTPFVPDVMPNTDVNGDGIVNHQDVQLVLAALENAPAAPSLDTHWTATSLQRWIAEAKQRNIGDAILQRGIAVLERLLVDLLPKEIALLANYPNPFNPETWIPYQLSEPTDVTLHIYAVDGQVVRQLTLGHQPAGMYHSKSRAAYWDGRNEQGEHVASGVYFYTLSAGNFSATRKMLIRK